MFTKKAKDLLGEAPFFFTGLKHSNYEGYLEHV